MSKTIIVTSSDKVNELLSHNFKFVYDSVNGKQVHAFLICDELIGYVNKHFSKKLQIMLCLFNFFAILRSPFVVIVIMPYGS